jgi:hypothetical protein
MSTDSTYGSNGQIVFFRNYASGRNYTTARDLNAHRAMYLGGYQQSHASIGNVLLHPDFVGSGSNRATVFSVPPSLVVPLNAELNTRLGTTGVIYANSAGNLPIAVYRLGDSGWNLSGGTKDPRSWDDGRSYNNLHRHLDYNPIEGLYTNPVNPETMLPNSLYLDGQPAWFTGTWPPVNPFGTTHADRVPGLPAKTRAGHGANP